MWKQSGKEMHGGRWGGREWLELLNLMIAVVSIDKKNVCGTELLLDDVDEDS